MARPRRNSAVSEVSTLPDGQQVPHPPRPSTEPSQSLTLQQELGSMYDYLAKVILLGPSGAGKFVGSEKTTAGTERFRSVSRSYYRGAAGAILVYDVASLASFNSLPTFLTDAKALASPQLTVILAGNKADLVAESQSRPDSNKNTPEVGPISSSASSRQSTFPPDAGGGSVRSRGGSIGLGSNWTATTSADGREVAPDLASMWASRSKIPVTVEVSALSGENVDELFNRLARMILTKIELGETDPDDPQSGIQYGDGGTWDGSSVKSGMTFEEDVMRRGPRRRGGNGLLGGAAPSQKAFLREIHADHEPEVDIVAVHGLDPRNNARHAYSTWSQRIIDVQGEVSEVLWLKDLLPKNPRTPRIRVLLYGYNSSALVGASTAGVHGASRNLLDELRIKRKDCSNRPLVFVCHSLGGIVAKNAFIDSYIDPNHKAIFDSTKGFAFFATPHHGGGNKASLGDAVVNVIRALGFARNDIMVSLRKDSIITGPINQNFRHLIKEIRIVSFIETWPTAHLGLIVGRSSAVLDLTNEDQVDMEASHSTICKFSDPNDDLYRRMEDHIINLLTGAAERLPPELSLSVSQDDPLNPTDPLGDTPPPYKIAIGSSMVLKPGTAAARGRSRSGASDYSDTEPEDEQHETPQALRMFRVLSPFRVFRRSISNITPVMEGVPKEWPLLMPPFFPKLKTCTQEMIERPLLVDQVVAAMNQGAPIALYGIGGSGKTELALCLAEWFVDRNPGSSILWINASSRETCSTNLDEITAACGIHNKGSTYQYMSLKTWLEDFTHGRWLMIFDGAVADGVDYFLPYLPRCNHGQVIFTSNTQAIAEMLAQDGSTIQVGSFDSVDAEALIASGLKEELLISDQTPSIKEIVLRLGGLPLAVTQAVSFMNANKLPPSAYLEEISTDDRLSNFLEFSQSSSSKDTPKTLYTAWKLSFDRLGSTNPMAVEILAVAAFLAPHDIPLHLITSTLGRSSLNTSLEDLQNYSFIATNMDTNMLNINAVVQVGIQRWLKDKKQYWAEKILTTISEVFPDAEDPKTWKDCTSLLPHALKILSLPTFALSPADLENYVSSGTRIFDTIITLRSKIGICFFRKGSYLQAEEQLQIAVVSSARADDHIEVWTLRAQEALILTIREQGHDAAAHEMAVNFKRATKARYGKKNLATAEAYRLLSLTFQTQGENKLALKAARKALASARLADGNEVSRNLSILRCQRRVGTMYELLCKFPEAEDALKEAAFGYKARGEEKSREALDVQFRLSWLQRAQGYYEDSAITARECYKDLVKLMGPHHPQTLKALHSLALTKQAQELWEEAADDIEAILEQCIATPGFGPQHRYAQLLRFNLAQIYEGMSPLRYSEAKELYVSALRNRRANLARDHPETLLNRAELLRIEWKLKPDDHAPAISNAEDLLKTVSKAGGDLETEWSLLSTLAEINAYKANAMVSSANSTTSNSTTSEDQKQTRAYWKDAVAWQTQVVKRKTKTLGRRHPSTIKSAAAYVRYLEDAGDSKASAMREKYKIASDQSTSPRENSNGGSTSKTYAVNAEDSTVSGSSSPEEERVGNDGDALATNRGRMKWSLDWPTNASPFGKRESSYSSKQWQEASKF